VKKGKMIILTNFRKYMGLPVCCFSYSDDANDYSSLARLPTAFVMWDSGLDGPGSGGNSSERLRRRGRGDGEGSEVNGEGGGEGEGSGGGSRGGGGDADATDAEGTNTNVPVDAYADAAVGVGGTNDAVVDGTNEVAEGKYVDGTVVCVELNLTYAPYSPTLWNSFGDDDTCERRGCRREDQAVWRLTKHVKRKWNVRTLSDWSLFPFHFLTSCLPSSHLFFYLLLSLYPSLSFQENITPAICLKRKIPGSF
jgi:hypothetical protein